VNPELKAAFTMVLQILGMTFPAPGIYTFQVSVDGRDMNPLRLVLTEAPEQPNAVGAQQEAMAR
jgi:hypothetical protein